MGSIGAVFGGLFLGLRDLIPYLAAQRSGVILRKGARGERIQRAADPERFERLLANRAKSAGAGFGLTMVGALVLVLFALAVTGTATGPFAVLLILVVLGFGLVAGWCLVRGFLTGRMFGFWSAALYGEAPLKGNPIWFWVYALANVVTLLSAASILLRIAA